MQSRREDSASTHCRSSLTLADVQVEFNVPASVKDGVELVYVDTVRDVLKEGVYLFLPMQGGHR